MSIYNIYRVSVLDVNHMVMSLLFTKVLFFHIFHLYIYIVLFFRSCITFILCQFILNVDMM